MRLAAKAPVVGEDRVVGLGAAAGEGHELRVAADEPRHLFPRRLDSLPRGAPLGVDRGGVADLAERGDHGVAGLGTERRRGVVVEVEARSVHGPQAPG